MTRLVPVAIRSARWMSRGRLRPAIALFVLLAAAYSFSMDLRASRGASITGDEPFYLLTTQSLLQDHDFDLAQQYDRRSYHAFFDHPAGLWKQSPPREDGSILSPHDPGLSVLLLPGFALGSLRGAQIELLLIAAATFAMTFALCAGLTGRRRASWAITAIVASTAPAFVYSTEVYPEAPAACCLVGALLAVRAGRGARAAAALALLLTVTAWLGIKYLPLALPIAGFFLLQASNPGRRWLAGLGVLSGVLYVWGHLALFGSLQPYSSNTIYEGATTASVLESHVAFQARLYRLWGLFIDRRFGVGHWAPLLLAIWPALPLLARGGRQGGLIAALIVIQVLVATFAAITMMGWWFPGRMLMVVFPLFAIVLTFAWAAAPRTLRTAGGVAAGWSLAITAALVVAGRSHDITMAVNPFDLGSPAFAALNPLFPKYTYWSVETELLNAVWLSAGIATLAACSWRVLAPLARMPGSQRAGQQVSAAARAPRLWVSALRGAGRHE